MLHTQFENQITYGKIQKRLQWVLPSRETKDTGQTYGIHRRYVHEIVGSGQSCILIH